MTCIGVSDPRAASSTTRSAALVFAAVLSCLNAQMHAQESARPSSSEPLVNAPRLAETLEKDFWACDYVATIRGVGLDEGAACVENFEDLKRSKFGGDFPAMLSWWQQHKAAEHRALATVSRAIVRPKTDQMTSR
jgi:hypothetical protein